MGHLHFYCLHQITCISIPTVAQAYQNLPCSLHFAFCLFALIGWSNWKVSLFHLIISSLYQESHAIAHAHTSTRLNQFTHTKILMFKEVLQTLHHTHKNCLHNDIKIIVKTIFACTMQCLYNNNENFNNLHNNKLQNGLETQVNFLKYHWNLNISEILKGVLHMNNVLELLLKYHFHPLMTSLEI